MRKKYSYSALGILMVLLLFALVAVSSDTFLGWLIESTYAAIIRYTAEGFSPAIVTIRNGETVRWVNESGKDMVWVASTPHPTHSDYPEFDQLYAIGAGREFSFTFSKPGIWGYHNHENPQRTGRIVVL